eukprot:s637_g10.t1
MDSSSVHVPFQYALSTEAGSEALVRAIRAATESDPRTTVLSVDGVGAYDHISRQSMLSQHLRTDPSIPFAALFYGTPSTYVFYDEEGRAHDARARLHPSNTLYAPARGTPTSRCIWAKHARGTARGGSPVLGSPIGSREFVATKLAQRLEEQDRLLSRIPHVPNLKSAWLLLLYCPAPRSTHLLRTLYTADFAASHDAAIQHCLAQMLAGGDGDIARAQLPLSMRGLGLGSAVQQRHAGRSGHPSPPAAGRDGQWNPPPSSEQQNRPTLRRLPCANLGTKCCCNDVRSVQ